jgi:hypothetical protein
MMEDLMLKYSFGECTKDELAELETLIEHNPALKIELANIQALDQVMIQAIKPMALDSVFQEKLNQRLNQQFSEPLIKIETSLDVKNSWDQYLAPIFFAIGSLVFLLLNKSNQINVTNNEFSTILTTYALPVMLGSICLLGWYFFDSLLSKKSYQKPMLFSI